ncbi:MAG: SUMF1/EgtB/PvdO family nonheme iron enzyme, partial [Myxococcota bacterium]|nr:SUMF1/EgtB/PvdO family nonheme iron enzyme [Myxococcota bacterium]
MIALLLLACTGAEPTPSESAPPPPLPSPQAAAPAAEKSAVPRGPSDRSAAPADCPSGTLPVPGGRFVMGQSGPEPGRDEQPVHLVRVDGFCMDRTEMTRSGE